MIDSEKREFGAWWLWVLLLIVISVPVVFALNAAGLIGRTMVERAVFEQSYQRKAGDTAKLSLFIAQRSSFQRQLRGTDLSQGQRADFEAQLNAIEIQISTVRTN